MSKRISRSSGCCFLVTLVLLTCGPAVAQYSDRLGGHWNNPASATIKHRHGSVSAASAGEETWSKSIRTE